MSEAQHLVGKRFTGCPTNPVHNPVDDSVVGLARSGDGIVVVEAAPGRRCGADRLGRPAGPGPVRPPGRQDGKAPTRSRG